MGVVVDTGMGLRDGSGTRGLLEITLADRNESVLVTCRVSASPDPEYLLAQVDVFTTEPSIEVGMPTDNNIAPRTDSLAHSSTIKTEEPSVDDADAKAITIAGVDDLDVLVCFLSDEL